MEPECVCASGMQRAQPVNEHSSRKEAKTPGALTTQPGRAEPDLPAARRRLGEIRCRAGLLTTLGARARHGLRPPL